MLANGRRSMKRDRSSSFTPPAPPRSRPDTWRKSLPPRASIRSGIAARAGPRPRERPSCTSRSACGTRARSEEHTSELQSLAYLVCRLLLEKKKKKKKKNKSHKQNKKKTIQPTL